MRRCEFTAGQQSVECIKDGKKYGWCERRSKERTKAAGSECLLDRYVMLRFIIHHTRKKREMKDENDNSQIIITIVSKDRRSNSTRE